VRSVVDLFFPPLPPLLPPSPFYSLITRATLAGRREERTIGELRVAVAAKDKEIEDFKAIAGSQPGNWQRKGEVIEAPEVKAAFKEVKTLRAKVRPQPFFASEMRATS
jgi:hypothetical protein